MYIDPLSESNLPLEFLSVLVILLIIYAVSLIKGTIKWIKLKTKSKD